MADTVITDDLVPATDASQDHGASGARWKDIYLAGKIDSSSTQLCPNLNADLWDGRQFDIYVNQPLLTTAVVTFLKLILTQATGTAPMTVSSTTKVSNLNADLLDGEDSSDLKNFAVAMAAAL